MKNYKEFQTDDFVQDPYFRSWALGMLPESDTFWTDWIAKNPYKKDITEEAKMLVIALQIEEEIPADLILSKGIERIFSETIYAKVIPLYNRSWFRIAAALVLISGLAFLAVKFNSFNLFDSDKQVVVIENTSSEKKTFILNDGSKVTVEQGGRLLIAEDFGKTKRTVYLTGEAFFDITKNPEKPFLVITDNLVTRVLGTSFWIKADKNNAEISVSVRTGKVTVFQKTKSSEDEMPVERMILTPNQEAVFVRSESKLVKTLVEEPVLLNPASKKYAQFEFEETAITEVFSELEKAYGVRIIYDTELLENCNLTATLGNEPLFEKLDLICETIKANYEIADGQVIINAKGCK